MYVCMYVCMFITVHKPSTLKTAINLQLKACK